MSLLLLFNGPLAIPAAPPPPPAFPFGGHGVIAIDGLGRLSAIAPDPLATTVTGPGHRIGIVGQGAAGISGRGRKKGID